MHTRQLWREAVKPDVNLGDAQPGPSPHKITHGAAQRVLAAMKIERGASTFLELGSGHCLVCFSAVLDHGASSARGIELRALPCEWAKEALARLKRSTPVPLDIEFACGDLVALLAAPDRPSATHIYAFDFDYPPEVLYAIATYLYLERDAWRVFASANDAKDWLCVLREMRAPGHVLDFFERHFRERRTHYSVTLAGGANARHTIYLFDNERHASETVVAPPPPLPVETGVASAAMIRV